jgi:hypothetical protein
MLKIWIESFGCNHLLGCTHQLIFEGSTTYEFAMHICPSSHVRDMDPPYRIALTILNQNPHAAPPNSN